MIYLVITFLTLIVVVALMALKTVLGYSDQLQRGCGNDCECLRDLSKKNSENQL